MDLLRSKRGALLLPLLIVAASVLADQEIDRQCGLLDIPWDIAIVRLFAWSDLPPQMRWGFPPYDQQPGLAQKSAPICRVGAITCI
jgi:hypothetical protein